MEPKWKVLVEKYHDEGVSLAGITSLLYFQGLTGLCYMEARKFVGKELQRIQVAEHKTKMGM